MLNRIIITAALTSLAAPTVLAQSDARFVCTKNDTTRTIKINYAGDAPVPCSVSYQKGTASEQVLWAAQNSKGYCEEKATAFVEQQRNWGWECGDAELALNTEEQLVDDMAKEAQ
ncbi:hypothetical protein [Marinagarivorans algicola]|uniref:hypothetical protein n=1 Tax=Marinagarivorans algicola TaxID=1513270 RepID=UPI0006B5A1E8|nr:hypothetical protein [Marinagarivorans algicola]